MHTDGAESGRLVHGKLRALGPDEPRRCDGHRPIGVHRCASVVPGFLLASSHAARRRSRPRLQRASKSPCTRTVHPRPVPAASSNAKTPCTNSRVARTGSAVMPGGLAVQAKAHAPIRPTPGAASAAARNDRVGGRLERGKQEICNHRCTPMHTDGAESGRLVHGKLRALGPDEPCRCDGHRPIVVHRCASVVPGFLLASSHAARRRSRPRPQRASKSPCTRTVHPRPVPAASSNAKTPCTNSCVARTGSAVMLAGLAVQAKAHAPIRPTPGAAGAAAGKRPMRDPQQEPLAPIQPAVAARQGRQRRARPHAPEHSPDPRRPPSRR